LLAVGEDIPGFLRQDDIANDWKRKGTVHTDTKMAIFDGHNDAVQHLAEYLEADEIFSCGQRMGTSIYHEPNEAA
jgi:hypothetical protein